MGRRGKKRSRTENLVEKAEFESSHGEESKRLLRERAGFESSHEEENKRLLGFACPDCCEFQLDLARDALRYYQGKNKDDGEYDVVQVLAASFSLSWPLSVLPPSYKELCHISFSAKPKSKSDVSLKWFFAEFLESADGVFLPFGVEVLDPYDNGIVYGCSICPPHSLYPHPRDLGLYLREGGAGSSSRNHRHRHRRIKRRKDQWL